MKYNSLLKSIWLFLFICVVSEYSIAQTTIIDSLRNVLTHPQPEKEKTTTLLGLIHRNYSLPPDTFYKYLILAKKIIPKNTPEYFITQNYYCTYLSKTGQIDAALKLNDRLLKSIPSDNAFQLARFSLYNVRSNILIRINHVKESIEQSLKGLQEAEDAGDTLFMVRAYILLGYANMEVENFTEAIKWLNKGCALTQNENILKQCGFLFSNNASCYNNIYKPDSAFYFINLALKYGRMDENLSVQANALNIRADMYIKKNDFKKAEADLKDALEIRKKIGDVLMVVSDMGQLATFYASINQTDKGIIIANQGIEIIKNTTNLPKLLYVYQALADNYKQAGRMSEYATILENILNLKDSLNAKNSEQAIAEMNAKYELEKKQKIILKQEFNLQRNRSLAIISVIALAFGIILALLIYRNTKSRQKVKSERQMARQKLLSEKAIRTAEENERKRIAADLHDNLGSNAAAISSNVRYLKDNAGKINDDIIDQLEQNAQNIVTQLSDTIWVLKTEHVPITNLADRFKAWIQRLIKNYPLVKYYYEEEIENDIEFTPSEILHIFLILKECVNNALKHSKGTELRIRVVSNAELKIIIDDNGIGIDSKVINQPSGMQNIMNRAKECNWQVEWQNVVPTGTRVVLSANTTN